MQKQRVKQYNKLYSGFTLVELLIVISIGSAILASVGYYSYNSYQQRDINATAIQIKKIANAAKKYINEYSNALIRTAKADKPSVIPVSVLLQYDDSLATNNYAEQNYCVLVLQPSVGYLQGLVITEGGEKINDIDLAQIAVLTGANGGGVYSTNLNNIIGTNNGWNIPINNFAKSEVKCGDGTSAGKTKIESGHAVYALWFKTSRTGINTQVLYRNEVPGQPELATMNTPIIMNTTQILGLACNVDKAIANLADGSTAYCLEGNWQRVVNTEAPVSCFSVEAEGETIISCGKVVFSNDNNDGTITLVDNTGQNIYLQNKNNKWQVLANNYATKLLEVDQSGNLTTEGTVKGEQGIVLSANKHIISDSSLSIQSPAKASTHYYGKGKQQQADDNNYGQYVYGNNISNVNKKDVDGSININDMYIRSVGKWMSEIWDKLSKKPKKKPIYVYIKREVYGEPRQYCSSSGRSCYVDLSKGMHRIRLYSFSKCYDFGVCWGLFHHVCRNNINRLYRMRINGEYGIFRNDYSTYYTTRTTRARGRIYGSSRGGSGGDVIFRIYIDLTMDYILGLRQYFYGKWRHEKTEIKEYPDRIEITYYLRLSRRVYYTKYPSCTRPGLAIYGHYRWRWLYHRRGWYADRQKYQRTIIDAKRCSTSPYGGRDKIVRCMRYGI